MSYRVKCALTQSQCRGRESPWQRQSSPLSRARCCCCRCCWVTVAAVEPSQSVSLQRRGESGSVEFPESRPQPSPAQKTTSVGLLLRRSSSILRRILLSLRHPSKSKVYFLTSVIPTCTCLLLNGGFVYRHKIASVVIVVRVIIE